MRVLTGSNLGARQQEINKKVNLAIKNKINFDFSKVIDCEDFVNDSVVDIMYKIDISSNLKNMSYILKVLKSGDEFAITRALNKCTWICDDAFMKYINPEYICYEIFPLMSIKMKKKFMTKISMNLKNEKRLIDFYQLCCEDETFHSIAPKFLRLTSESYKIEQTEQQHKWMPAEGKRLKYFIEESFTLAQNHLDTLTQPSEKNVILFDLRNMYSVSDDKYLDLLETHFNFESQYNGKQRFGQKLSKKIMKNHKDRVYENPQVYMNILNPKVVTKYSAYDEAELYASTLLPADVSSFWSSNFCETYKFILDLVKPVEKFSFVKKIFNDKYPNEDFDASFYFFESKLYNIMTVQEKEDWALRSISNGQQLFDVGNEYMFYGFLTFDKAFEYFQKDIQNVIPQQRLPMLIIMVDSARSHQDLEKLLRFYYDNITDEPKQNTESFLNAIIKQKNPLNFNDSCWVAFEKLLWGLGVYDNYNYQIKNNDFIVITLMHYIVNGKVVPETLNEFLNMTVIHFPTILDYGHQLKPEMLEKIYQFIYNYYLSKIKQTVAASSLEEKQRELYKYLHCVLDLMLAFKKNKDDIPEFLKKLMWSEWEKFQYHNLFISNYKFGEGFIRQYLKSNAALVIHEFQKIQDYISCQLGYINWLINKLRIYFSNDIAKGFVNKLRACLSKEDLSQVMAAVAIRGIFILADEPEKVKLLEEFIHKSPLLNENDNISQRNIKIQREICKQACFSRPPLPLPKVMGYIIEYTSYCFPMFYIYSTKLPETLFFTFVKSLCDNLPSIQRHGIVLAFKYFNADNLKNFAINAWGKTTDPSMRAIIYTALMKKFRTSTEKSQQRLFPALICLTEDLKEDDRESIFFEISVYHLPKNFRSDFLVAAWQAFNKFTEKPCNLQRMTYLIEQINEDICIIPEHILDGIIKCHLKHMFNDKQILNNYSDEYHCRIIKAKWDLTARNLCYVIGEQRLSKNLDFVKTIFVECVEMWNEVCNETYVIREFCTTFLSNVERYSYSHSVEDYDNINILFNSIIAHLKTTLPDHETNILIWNLRLNIETKKILFEEVCRDKYDNEETEITLLIVKCVVKFGEAFGNLMIEYIASNQYFSSLHAEIENVVVDKMIHLKNCLDRENYVDMPLNDMVILLCTGLVQFEIIEIYMFMLRILPTNYSDTFLVEYKSVIKTIKSFPSDEIKYFLYEKFVNTGFSNFINTF